MNTIQLQLLQHSCGLRRVGEPGAPTDGDDDLHRAARLITQGAFLDAVRSVPALRSLLDCSADTDAVHDAASYYALVGRRAAAAVEAAISAGGAEAVTAAAAAAPLELEVVLVAGIACLHIFGQHNLTGPTYAGAPPSPLDLFAPPPVAKHMAEAPPRPPAALAAAAIAAITGGGGGAAAAKGDAASAATAVASVGPSETSTTTESSCSGSGTKPGTDGLAGLGVDSLSRGDRWAGEQLQLDGEDLVGRIPAVQWLLLARVLLLGALRPPTPTTAPTGQPQQQQPPHSEPAVQDPQGEEREAPAAAPTSASTCPPFPATTTTTTTTPLPHLTALLRSGGAGDSGSGGAGGGGGVAPWSWAWWALRCVLSQQHVLEGRAHSLLSEASQLIQALVAPQCPWAHPPPATAAAGGGGGGGSAAAACSRPTGQPAGPVGHEAAALGGVLFVELALCQYLYGYVDAGRQYLGRAGQLLGLEPHLTGALGKRTVHQIDPKAQLVVVASGANRAAPPSSPSTSSPSSEEVLLDQAVEQLGLTAASSAAAAAAAPAAANAELAGMAPESDVLQAPLLLGEDGALLETRYSAPEQALLLAWATAVKKGTSADDLQEWQMAPWVEAVLSQPRAVFMTAATAQLQKIRHERTRGRTRERALLAMDALAEAITGAPPPPQQQQQQQQPGEGEPAAAEAVPASAASASEAAVSEAVSVSGLRAVLSWAVWFPLQVKLRREAAEHYVSMGLVGAAIREFELLELWDSALTCYRLMGKKALAEELIRRRLGVTPDDPRLWCALGDMHLDDRYYEEAWRRSGERHTRSQRSLARSAMRRKDYSKASAHWESALSLNPLHPEAWFAAGFCALKQDRHRQALRAFTRVTQQEPDNGEAWNNIAALWMHLGGYRPAFAALSESVRHKRDSWQTWENYARAALGSGHYQQAVRGLQMSLRLSSGQRLFLDVASGLLDVLEGREPPRDGGTSMAAAAAAAAEGLQGVAGAEEAEGSLQEDEAALGVPLLPLLSDLPLGRPSDGDDEAETPAGDDAPALALAAADGSGGGGADAAAAAADAAQPPPCQLLLLSGREREVVVGGLGSLLREAVNCAAASAALWGCLARYWALQGEQESAKEARIKQVRGLSSGAYKSDVARFVEYAEASEALGRCYLATYQQGRPGGLKDLAAGRMHLRGLLKATAENFGEQPMSAKLQALLDEITQLEDAALAASRAAAKS